jgi:carboxyl-terminal processing protease
MSRMTRGKAFFLGLSIVFTTALVAGGWVAAQGGPQANDSIYKYLAVFTETFHQIRQSYVDETRSETLLEAAFDGMSDALDPFSLYVPAAGVERYRTARLVGSAHSGLQVLKERGVPYVVSVEPGSAGDAAGVESGDLIAEIDGRATRTIPLWELRALLAQPVGTKVALQLLRRGEPRSASVTLRVGATVAATLGDREGVPILRLPVLGAQSASDVARLLGAPRKPALSGPGGRLIVDLRGTGRGDAAHAYEVAALFANGDLGATLTRGEPAATFRGAPPIWSGTLIVLVDRATIGAAEVLATVLRQAAGARLVGERTFGYTGRQKLVPLAAGGALEITDAFFTGPDRTRLERGLRPDLLVDERSRSFAERDTPIEQLILDRAIELLRTDLPRAA